MASVNDKIITAVPMWSGTVGTGGVADSSATTVPLASASGLTEGSIYVVTIDRVDSAGVKTLSKREVVIGEVSGDNLINCLRGQEGTAQAHSAGAVVEVLFTAKQWNRLADAMLVGHTQAGLHDLNGGEMILDADGDTSITADTDDQIDVKIANADDFKFTANTFAALSGSKITTNTIDETTSATGVTIDGVLVKDGDVIPGTDGGIGYSGTSGSMGDDSAYSFAASNGFLLFRSVSNNGLHGLIEFRSGGTDWTNIVAATANVEVTTGALAGTTGTDAKFTVSTHTDGKIYFENRIGAARTIVYLILCST